MGMALHDTLQMSNVCCSLPALPSQAEERHQASIRKLQEQLTKQQQNSLDEVKTLITEVRLCAWKGEKAV